MIKLKLTIVMLIVLVIALFGVNTMFAQNNNNEENSEETDNNNDNTLFNNNDDNDNDDTLFDNNDEGENNEWSSDDFDAEIPKPDYEKFIKIGFGTDILLKNNNVMEQIYGEDNDIPNQQFQNTGVFGRFTLDVSYLGFGLTGDIEILSTFNSENVNSINFYLNKLYLDYLTSVFYVKIGRFMAEWSNADLLKINNFFSSPIIPDFRPYSEYNQLGINGVLSKFFINKANLSIELIFVPVPLFDEIPKSELNKIMSMQNETLTVTINNPTPGIAISNFETGVRIGTTFSGIDLYLSYFHGYYKNSIIYTMETILSPDPTTEPNQLIFTRIYNKINAIGLNLAFNIANKIAVRVEYNTMFNFPLIFDKLDDSGLFSNKVVSDEISFAYTIGLDFEIISNLMLLMEYSDIWFTGGIQDIDYTMYPTTKNILLTLEYVFYEDRFSPYIFGAFNYELGSISIGAGMDVDFLNGFFIESSIIYIMEIYSELDGILESEDRSFKINISAYYQF